jgi:hypothetical protein
MKRGRAEKIAREVRGAVARWREFAASAGVAPRQAEMIAGVHRLEIA